jgi:SnoaL-like domain
MAESTHDPTGVVGAWHDAVNAGDVERAVALCDDDVEVGGPQGTGSGHDLMRSWLRRSGIRLEPQHGLRESDGHVLVHELARWTTPDAPAQAPTERPVDTWVVFRARSGRLTSVVRYETEEDALRAVAAGGTA